MSTACTTMVDMLGTRTRSSTSQKPSTLLKSQPRCPEPYQVVAGRQPPASLSLLTRLSAPQQWPWGSSRGPRTSDGHAPLLLRAASSRSPADVSTAPRKPKAHGTSKCCHQATARRFTWGDGGRISSQTPQIHSSSLKSLSLSPSLA